MADRYIVRIHQLNENAKDSNRELWIDLFFDSKAKAMNALREVDKALKGGGAAFIIDDAEFGISIPGKSIFRAVMHPEGKDPSQHLH